MADPEFISAVDEPNYRQTGTRVTGQRLKGKAVSRHVQPAVVNSIPSKFETVLYTGDSEIDGFRSRTVRFKPALADIPGPGAYHAATTLISASDSHSKKGFGVGFVSKKDRFGSTYSATAGPGRYEHKDFLQQGKYDFSTSTNTSQFRNRESQPRTIQHRQLNPGPGTYDPERVKTKERRDRKHALLTRLEPAGHRTSTIADDTTQNTDAISSPDDATPSSSSRDPSASASRRTPGKSVSTSELPPATGAASSITGRRLFTATELARDQLAKPRRDSAPRLTNGVARGIVAHEPILSMLAAPNTERNGASDTNTDGQLPAASASAGANRRAKFQHEDQPFLSTTHRFTSSVRNVPAPGAYNPPLANQIAFTSHDGVSVPFKSRTTRASYVDAIAGAKGPGPGYYTNDATSDELKQSASSSMFKIQHTNRFGIPIQRRKAVANTPGPGSYEPAIPTDLQHATAGAATKKSSNTHDEKDTSMVDEDRDNAIRGGPPRDRSFPINSPPLKRPSSPSSAAAMLSSPARVVPSTQNGVPTPSQLRAPGPAYYNPAVVDKKSFHLNATSKWI